MNSLYKNEHDEIIPAIRKIYDIDEMGFPVDNGKS